MKSTSPHTKPDSTVYNHQTLQRATVVELYERYAPAFYGEIKRNLYQQEICNLAFTDAYQQIWENIDRYDKTKGSLFAWCFRIVRREIQKRKVELMLKEIFACQPNVVNNGVLERC
jgi:DNA-directed RNA polymerase specialized sigma24 family protein